MKNYIWLVALLLVRVASGVAQTNIPLANPTFDFTTLPSGSIVTTGWTEAGGNGVTFTPSPSGSSSDKTANAPGWSSIGSGTAGFQRLSGVWAGTVPSGGVGYANNGGELAQTVTNTLQPSMTYVLSGNFYLRSTDPFPPLINVSVALADETGNPLNAQLALSPATNGVITFQLAASTGATVIGTNLTVIFANSSASYAQMNFDNLQLTAQPALSVTNPPPPPPGPVAMAPQVYGSRPGSPLLVYLAAVGVGTNRIWTAGNLPSGLQLNTTNGLISGQTPSAGEYDIPWSVTGSLGTAGCVLHLASGTQLALTPPIGWNSWNVFEGTVSETNVEQIADAIVNSGLIDYGFAYVNLDDEWAQSARVPVPLSSGGSQMCLLGNTNRFPSGLASLGQYLHQRGLKFGIYSDAANTTCSGDQPGSYGFESIDAGTFASWGVDYVKYDYCGAPSDESDAILRYTAMGNALANSGRSVVLSVCEWGQREPWLWAAEAGGSLWRTTFDMRDEWEFATNDVRSQDAIGVLDGLDLAAGLQSYQMPGAWNDPDMLMVGVPLAGSVAAYGASGLSLTQQQAMFSVWALLSAPLIFNADLRQLDPQSSFYDAAWAAGVMSILTNTEVWAVDQDRLGQQASRVRLDGAVDIWRKNLWDGSIVLGLINRGSAAQVAAFSPTDAQASGPLLAARDLWLHQDLGVVTNNMPFALGAYQTRLLRLRPARLQVALASQNTVGLSFDAGAVLETSDNLQQWQVVPSSGTNLEVSVPDACRYWRLQMP